MSLRGTECQRPVTASWVDAKCKTIDGLCSCLTTCRKRVSSFRHKKNTHTHTPFYCCTICMSHFTIHTRTLGPDESIDYFRTYYYRLIVLLYTCIRACISDERVIIRTVTAWILGLQILRPPRKIYMQRKRRCASGRNVIEINTRLSLAISSSPQVSRSVLRIGVNKQQ